VLPTFRKPRKVGHPAELESLSQEIQSNRVLAMKEKLQWLEAYSGQKTSELIGLEREYCIPSLILAFEEAIARESMHRRLSEEERIVLAVEALEREVNNGGYSQFFITTPHLRQSSLPGCYASGVRNESRIPVENFQELVAGRECGGIMLFAR